MPPWLQGLAVAVIVAACAALMLRRLVATFRPKDKPGCGGCGTCPASKPAPPPGRR